MNREQVEETLREKEVVRVAFHANQRSKWEYADTQNMRSRKYNHRDVLPDEVVLDFDEEELSANIYWSNKVSEQLHRLGVKHSLWTTGGKGTHIHTFWEGLDEVAEPRDLKNLLADWMIEGISVKVDRQLMGKHLVRFEWGHYEKALPDKKFKEPVHAEDHFKYNKIPGPVFEKYKKNVVDYALRRLRWKHSGVKYKYETPCCMKYIASDEFAQHKDGGKRAMFVMASYYSNLPNEELGPLLSRYNKYNLKKPLPKETIIGMVKSVRAHKGRKVGCRYRHELFRDIGAGHIAEKCEKEMRNKLERMEDSHNNDSDKKRS